MTRARRTVAALVVVISIAVYGPAPAAPRRPQSPRVSCHACVLVDDVGRVLFARRADTPFPNASTTKMVTALLVMELAELDETVVISEYAARTGGGGLDLVAQDRYVVRDLLYALLLTSSNDAAVALAEHSLGSEGAFVAAMNRFVRALGARSTHFESPHGLDLPGHRSTANDLATIASELLRDPVLARIVATRRARIAGPRGSEVVENRNSLLGRYPGAIGVKTGYTSQAGDVLVAAAQREGRRVIAVAMRSEDAAVDSARLLDYGFERLERTILVRARTPVGELVFDPSGVAAAVAARAVRGMSHPDEVTVSFEPSSDLEPPIESGEVVGVVHVRDDDADIAVIPAVLAAPVEAPTRSWAASALARVLSAVADVVEPYLPAR